MRRNSLVRFGSLSLTLAGLATVNLMPLHAATYTTPRPLAVGDIYELRRDGWTNQVPSTYDGDVQPKQDANNALSSDNPYFRRHNVARAWPTGSGYWFTGSDQFADEPDPAGEQWVDYVPPFEILGPGRYSIAASYRWSTGRAQYPALYKVAHAMGTNEFTRDQRIGDASATIVYFNLGEFEMRPGSLVRVEDPGTESITFGNMRFRLVAPVPRLNMDVQNGTISLNWPTNITNYRLECSSDLGVAGSWIQVFENVTAIQGTNWVSFPLSDEQKYFRLIAP